MKARDPWPPLVAAFAPFRRLFAALGLDVQYFGRISDAIPDRSAYQPRFRPWLLDAWQRRFAPTRGKTLVSDDRLYVLVTLLEQALATGAGAVAECGVYQGGTARLLADSLAGRRTLYLCDTFAGMPPTDASVDQHREGDFAATSLDAVRAHVGGGESVRFTAGVIPDSLAPLARERFCFVHVDLDIYAAVLGASRFFYERVEPGGFIVYDDYGFASTPGARRAVDEFYAETPERPLTLASGQSVVIKAAAR